MVSKEIFVLFFSFICFVVSESVSNRNSIVHSHHLLKPEKKRMIHCWLLLPLSSDYSLSLSLVSFSFVALVTHSLHYIIFQPDSYTPSVSQLQQRDAQKQTSNHYQHNKFNRFQIKIRNISMLSSYFSFSFVFQKLFYIRSCVNVFQSMLVKLVFKLVMHAGNYIV